jgi:bacillopeptidase F
MARVNKTHGIAVLSILSLFCASSQAAELGAGVQQALLQGEEEVAVIVRFAGDLDLRGVQGQGRAGGPATGQMIRALRRQADESQWQARQLLQAGGVTRVVELWSINALATTARAELLRALASLPEVESITLDATLSAPAPQTAATALPEWNLDAVAAPTLWELGLTGSGRVIATMDTGIDAQHNDLALRWRGGANSWFDPNGEHPAPYDASGHGTQVLSLAVGGEAGGSAIGVAPAAQWIAVKIFNDAGVATLSGIHQGFQWLLDPDADAATNDMPDVVNNSWGFPSLTGECYTEFAADIAVLKAAGIAVLFSAGNQGSSGSVSPADNSDAYAVGAVDAGLSVAAFSSNGPSACDGGYYPDVVAPGVGLRAADLSAGGLFPDSYTSVSGTSYAAPHVSGMMALLRQAYPEATAIQLEGAITAGATDLAAAGPDNSAGYGLVNGPMALEWLASVISVPLCSDSDGDGFYAGPDCGTPVDCNDQDLTINPFACDIKGDGIDQDCDGADRLKGKSCPDASGGSGGGQTGGGSGGGGKGRNK